MLNQKIDLGLVTLFQEWKGFFTKKHLKQDIVSGITVACIALPLSLAIALASGVDPGVGIITAIVGGIVCALFGGAPLSVSGPAAAKSVLIASNVEQFGLGGLLILGIICGLLQIFSGIFGIGTLMKFFPVPVIGGFMAGIGVIIFIGQLPKAFGLPAPDQAHVIGVVTHIGSLISNIQFSELMIALGSLAIMFIAPKINKKLPAALIAIIIPTVVLYFFHFQNISKIGAIPSSLPIPRLPALSADKISTIVISAFGVYFLASLETLLSCSALDKLAKTTKHDPNQELIGQGFGNIASALFGGIPVTGVIARSSLNVDSGAKTRRSAIFHALILIACVYLFSSLIGQIPIAALSGILIFISFKMVDVRTLITMYQTSRSDSYIFVVTLLTIVLTDLIMGIQVGLIAAAIIALIRLAQTRIFVDDSVDSNNIIRCIIDGPLTFLSSLKIEKIAQQLAKVKSGQFVIIDMTNLTKMDVSGANLLLDFLNSLALREIKVILKGLKDKHKIILIENCESKELPFQIAEYENDVLGNSLVGSSDLKEIKARIIHGNEFFLYDTKHKNRKLFNKLADSQSPHTLFITCSDSRIVPNLITSCDPGELFVVRNVGNVIPSHDSELMHSESAAIEFAINALNIKTIIICGHTNCGAVKASYMKHRSQSLDPHSALDQWLKKVYLSDQVLNNEEFDQENASKDNVNYQMKRLIKYPSIQKKINDKDLAIFSWYYDIGTQQVQVYSQKNESFIYLSDFKKQIDEEFAMFDKVPTYPELSFP